MVLCLNSIEMEQFTPNGEEFHLWTGKDILSYIIPKILINNEKSSL